MNKIYIIFFVLLTGCAQTTGYKPVVDTYGDNRIQYIDYDMQDCQRIASQSSVAKGVAIDGLTGAVIGGATGAALGAIIGNPATGAAIGGTVGGIGGASKGGFEADANYKKIYRNCMRNRGHRILD